MYKANFDINVLMAKNKENVVVAINMHKDSFVCSIKECLRLAVGNFVKSLIGFNKSKMQSYIDALTTI